MPPPFHRLAIVVFLIAVPAFTARPSAAVVAVGRTPSQVTGRLEIAPLRWEPAP